MAEIAIARWKGNKRWAYSITYDQGWVETLGFAWRLHAAQRIPGHVNVFPDRVGRLTGDQSAGFLQSLWNLEKYAEPEHLRFLQGEGWTVGCQFPSDGNLPATHGRRVEFLETQRRALESVTGTRARCLAFQDATLASDWLAAAGQAGFDRVCTLHDALNDPDNSSSLIKRSPLYHLGAAPNHLAPDPYRLLALARDRGAWVVDCARVVDRFPRDPARDCTPAELQARFRALDQIGGAEVWIATLLDVADYRAVRTAAHLDDLVMAPQWMAFTLALPGASALPAIPTLTLVITPAGEWSRPEARPDGGSPIALQRSQDGAAWLFECPAIDALRVTVVQAEAGR